MMEDTKYLSELIIAATGAAATYFAHRLSKRGQTNDEKQQAAANKLQERIAAFDELEALNDRLGNENTRLLAAGEQLRALITEAEATGNMRLAQQAHRCRERMDDMVAALASLRAIVVSEVAGQAADAAVARARKHVADAHPDEQYPDLT